MEGGEMDECVRLDGCERDNKGEVISCSIDFPSPTSVSPYLSLSLSLSLCLPLLRTALQVLAQRECGVVVPPPGEHAVRGYMLRWGIIHSTAFALLEMDSNYSLYFSLPFLIPHFPRLPSPPPFPLFHSSILRAWILQAIWAKQCIAMSRWS